MHAGTPGGSDIPARPDTLIASYTYYFGIAQGKPVYFAKRGDDLITPRLFPDFNSALYGVTFYEEHSQDFYRMDYHAHAAISEECPSCLSDGCIACR